MIIEILKFRHKQSVNWKEIYFDNNTTIFYSETNSTGKTTLLRALLYSFGFSIPGTEFVDFNKYEFELILTNNGRNFKIYRQSNLIVINGIEFDLPSENVAALGFIFDIKNPELVLNLLGTIYFDQEKGWTLLNRGIVIGRNRFSIEKFFRGLKEDESSESYKLAEKIEALEQKIAQYKLLISVSEYQASLNNLNRNRLDYESYNQVLVNKISDKKNELSNIEKEIKELDGFIRNNKQFIQYIEKKKIYVKIPNSTKTLPVNKETLFAYDDIEDLNNARRSMLVEKRNSLKRSIAMLENSQDKNNELFSDIPSIDDALISRLSSINGINSVQINNLKQELIREKNKLNKILNARTKTDNSWINKAYLILNDYAKELKLPFNLKMDIFTHKLKEKSGAILHKMVFIYKLTYIRLLSEKLGYYLPIFCDSPSGREIEKETIDSMMQILKRDFNNHQIILASINRYDNIFQEKKVIFMKGNFFDKDNLL